MAVDWTRYTARSQAVIHLASDKARAAGQDTVTREHLLYGILADDHAVNVARHLLARHNVDLDRLGSILENQLVTVSTASLSAESIRASEPMLVSEDGVRVLEFAQEEAAAVGSKYFGTEHLLLGILHDPGAVVTAIMDSCGITYKDVRTTVIALYEGS